MRLCAIRESHNLFRSPDWRPLLTIHDSGARRQRFDAKDPRTNVQRHVAKTGTTPTNWGP